MTITDRYGNKRCPHCGTVYAQACQKCCDHELQMDNDHDEGVQIICVKCLKVFERDEFNALHIKVKGGR